MFRECYPQTQFLTRILSSIERLKHFRILPQGQHRPQESKSRGTLRGNTQNLPALAGNSYNNDTKGSPHFPEHQPWNGNAIQNSISDDILPTNGLIPRTELRLP